MMKNKKKTYPYITISLNPPLISYIDELIENGGYSSKSEIVREALRLHKNAVYKLKVAV